MKLLFFLITTFVLNIHSAFTYQNLSLDKVNKEITFQNSDIKLAGTLHLPSKTEGPVPAIIALHGAGAPDRNSVLYEHLTERLPEIGIAVLVFDRRGHGDSKGDFQTASFEDLALDAIAAMDRITKFPKIDEKRIGFWGISQGGWLAPLAATLTDNAAFCISVAGPAVTPSEQMLYFTQKTLKSAGFTDKEITRALKIRIQIDEYFRGNIPLNEIQQELKQIKEKDWYKLAYLPQGGKLPKKVTNTKWYHEFDYNPVPALKELEIPTLYIYGDADEAVPVAKSIEIMRKNLTNDQSVSWYIINGANHIISRGKIPELFDDMNPFSIEEYHIIMENWLRLHL